MRIIPARKINQTKFKEQWTELQGYCRTKNTWGLALINADKLLDEALKKKRYKGKSMGERLVNAQRDLTDNDAVWFGHNLTKKVINETATRLKETDVKKSLIGFRQALRDLGALE
jgi:hypothetical protein